MKSASGTYECATGETCSISVDDVFFDEVFEAEPADGYSFAGWRKKPSSFCGGKTEPCALSTKGFPGTPLAQFLDTDDRFYLEPAFEKVGLDLLTAQDRQKLTKIISVYSAGQSTCNALKKLSGQDKDASKALSACISSAPRYAILNLPAGRYRFDNYVVVDKPLLIRTLRKNIKDPGCSYVDNVSCAELVAGPALKPPARRGLLDITSADVTLGHIVINGSRESRRNSGAGKICAQMDNSYGFNLTVFGSRFTAYSSVTRDALCASGLALNAGDSPTIVNNVAAYNGVSDRPGMWADGMTIIDTSSAVVSRNLLLDNTDIDLIFGGCQKCRIQGNVIQHSDSFASSSFAGLMLHAWPHTSGDYTGTVTSNNKINCENKRCGFGLYLGSLSWYVAPMFGGIVRDNAIDNAMLGFNVERSTGTVAISNNRVSNSGGFHNTSCGTRKMGSYNISPDSIVDRSGDSISDAQYTHLSYAGCIPNYFNTNPTEKGDCDAKTQPPPTWGERDGFCLMACGALGGTTAAASQCSGIGLEDVGRAYDVEFCCN